jgi:hypothetical protein
VSRYLDEELVGQNIENFRHALGLALDANNIEKFYFEFKNFVKCNRKVPNNTMRTWKDWFDMSCYDKKKELIFDGFTTAYSNYDEESRRALLNARKEYKQMCNDKRVSYELRREEKIIQGGRNSSV